MDEQSHHGLQKMMSETDIKKFLSGDKMIVGKGVADYLKRHFYPESYNFMTPAGSFRKVDIFKVLSEKSDLLSNDMIIMPIELAREVLGLKSEEVSDIAFNVPNDDEWKSVENKVGTFYYDLRIISKQDVKKAYENLYNYKSGLFLILFLVAMITFVLILYQRYAMVYSSERRHIGLLRALGWSIRDVLKLKFLETMMVIIVAFVVGIFLAYLYVFVWGAPILKEIFLGGANLQNDITLVPVLDYGLLSSIFLIYAVPFVSAVLIPVWKISVTSPKEAML
jgi:ABC-type lipoprotein release transport system permease subunit